MPAILEGGGSPVQVLNPRSQDWVTPNQATVNIVDTTATQTLTNKTLTSPALNSPSIVGGSLNEGTAIINADLSAPLINGVVIGTNFPIYGVGTAYALTNTAAAVDFGTTDPSITITSAGTYLLIAQVQLDYAGATVVAETATVKLRRTNNTPADVAASIITLDLPVATTLTNTYGIFTLPPVLYTTAAITDAVTIFANVSATLGAGTVNAVALGTSIIAVRLY